MKNGTLRKWMKDTGLKPQALADAVGLHRSTIYRMRNRPGYEFRRSTKNRVNEYMRSVIAGDHQGVKRLDPPNTQFNLLLDEVPVQVPWKEFADEVRGGVQEIARIKEAQAVYQEWMKRQMEILIELLAHGREKGD